MRSLNCRLGDLAVVVRAELPENVGTIVRVVGVVGPETWFGFKRPTFLWTVDVAAEGATLTYEFEDGQRITKRRGELPDAFLRPLLRCGSDLAVSRNSQILREVANV